MNDTSSGIANLFKSMVLDMLDEEFRKQTGRGVRDERQRLVDKSNEVSDMIVKNLSPIKHDDVPAILLAFMTIGDFLDSEFPGAKGVAEVLRKMVDIKAEIRTEED